MTRDQLKADVQAKIDITGRRLTTGVATRTLFDNIIDSLFDQFGQSFTTTATLVANTDKVIVIPSATYSGVIRTFNVFDANGYEITSKLTVQKGVLLGEQTLTLNSAKTNINVTVNILLQ